MSTEAPEQVLNFLLIPSACYMLSTGDSTLQEETEILHKKNL